tara:strand:- start:3595 stop:4938 length:1344 start_codon:yes stop_codon:yes gene_type:complete
MGVTLEISYFNTFIVSGGCATQDGVITQNKPGKWHIEESRIKGGYNDKSVDFGVRAHLVDKNHSSRIRGNAMIYSGIFNSKTKINETNQFSIGESITKAVDIQSGTIQKLYAEDTNLIIFQENKVNKALIDKDAIFTAEGQPLTASSKLVIGQIVPFIGKYGISKNPESFAVYGNRKYFIDKKRGLVLRLSQDGITPISDSGMRSFFRENLPKCNRIYGMYDEQKNKYVVSLHSTTQKLTRKNSYSINDAVAGKITDDYCTLSFDEASAGWVSFYTYKPYFGFSLNNKFYTYNLGNLWQHYSEDVQRCSFYGRKTDPADVEFILNDQPSMIKNFLTIDYEGNSGWTMQSSLTDSLDSAYAIRADDIETSSISIPVKFKLKENKYYGHLRNNTNFNHEGSVVGIDLTGIKGYVNTVTMRYWKPTEPTARGTKKAELFAVGSEVVFSSQ